MRRITIGMIISIILIVIILPIQNILSNEKNSEVLIQADVIMPTKVSRPGCEETDSCYVPSKVFANINEEIVWVNEDAAFHSVTSGSYGKPTDLFDSGHLDPNQSFSLYFDKSGTYDYFCTLHPWMKGQIVIQ